MNQDLKLKRFLRRLKRIEGRHTELISIYIPADYSLDEIRSLLQDEFAVTQNVKDKTVRKNVSAAIKKLQSHLKQFKSTPSKGLALFCGNIAKQEGEQQIKLWSLEPPQKIEHKLYRCNKSFRLEPLEEQLKAKKKWGLLVLDRSEADFGIIKGRELDHKKHIDSGVPGATRAGGQCLSPEVFLQLADGKIIKIGEAKNPDKVKSVDFGSNLLRTSTIRDKWKSQKAALRIVTNFPRIEIVASKDHLFFTYDGMIKEKAASQIKGGDLLLIPEKIEIDENSQEINSNLYYDYFSISEEGRKNLKEARKSKGLLQRDLRKIASISRSEVSAIERGFRNVKNEILEEICRSLGVDFGKFVKLYCEKTDKIEIPSRISPKLARVAGYFLGDGSYGKERLNFCEGKKEVAEFYRRLLKEVFECNAIMKFRNDKNYYRVRAYGKPLVRMFKNEFKEIKSSGLSRIPSKILMSNNEIVASFLKGLFDAEGYISSGRVGLGLNNENLVKQLQLVLLRFGIISSFYRYDNRANIYSDETRYSIDISEKLSLEIFDKSIGFRSDQKKKKLKKSIKEKSSRSNVRQILVKGSKIREIIESYGLNLSKFPQVSNFFRDERAMSKQTFKNSILNEIKDEKLRKELKNILEFPLIPVKVSKIKAEGAGEMVDISVENGNFIANGLIVHNSAQRFKRIRQGLLNDFFKKTASNAKQIFETKLEGIVVGGPGPIKEKFLDSGHLPPRLKKRIIGVRSTGYTGKPGLRELLTRAEDLLKEAEAAQERKVCQQFFKALAEGDMKLAYGKDEVLNALKQGAVGKLLISEELETKLDEKAAEQGADVIFISTKTPEGNQLEKLGGIAAFLRFEI